MIIRKEAILNSSGFIGSACMKSGFSGVDLARECSNGAHSSNAAQPHLARLCSLNSEGLAHDRAAASNGLEVGHAATAGGGIASAGGERSESGRRSLFQERTHSLRLAKDSVHDCEF
jgi:hypothetical protein